LIELVVRADYCTISAHILSSAALSAQSSTLLWADPLGRQPGVERQDEV
jgi:hypothetical protein